MRRRSLLTALVLISTITLALALISIFIQPILPHEIGLILLIIAAAIIGTVTFLSGLKDSVELIDRIRGRGRSDVRDRLGSPLQQTNWQRICTRLGRYGGQIPWVDREATSVGMLRARGRLLIQGRSGTGKTREVAELILSAVSEELVSEERIFIPSVSFHQLSGPGVEQALLQNVDLTSPLLLFIEDLPRHFSGKGLTRLAKLLERISESVRVYVVADARLDQVSENHDEWIKEHDFSQIDLPYLDDTQAAEFADGAAGTVNMRLTNGAKRALIAITGGVPDLILMPILRLHSEGAVQINEELVRRTSRQTMSEAWAETNRYICRRAPATSYLIEALVQFHTSITPPYQSLVLHFAAALWAEDRSWWPPHVIKIRSLRRALEYLAHFDFAVVENTVAYPDHIVAYGSPTDDGSRILNFLLTHRRLFHGPLTRWLYRNAARHAEALFSNGFRLQEREHFERAKDAYCVAIRLWPNPWLYSNLGLVQFELGNVEGALASFNHAIAIGPVNALLLNNRGRTQVELGRFEEGIADYTRAIALQPEYAIAYYNRGLALAAEGDLDGAIEDWTKATRLKPDFSEAFNSRGAAHANRGDPELALADFNRSIEHSPEYAEAYCNRARARWMIGREYEKALADCDRSISLDPQGLDCYLVRGDVRAALGDIERAIDDYSFCIEHDRGLAEAHSNRGWAYLKRGNLDLAEDDYQERVRLRRVDAFMAYIGLGVIALARDDADPAKERFVRAISILNKSHEQVLRPTSAFEACVGEALAQLCLDHTNQAMKTLEESRGQARTKVLVRTFIEACELIERSPNPPAGIEGFIEKLRRML